MRFAEKADGQETAMMKVSALLVAQNFGEYANVGGAVADGVSRLRFVIEDRLRTTTPQTWAIVGGGLFVLWLVFRRRR